MSRNKLETSLVVGATPEFIARRIVLVRGVKVMLDSDLAELYQVEARVLNQSVKRNKNRFPTDFMFQLSDAESESMNSSQIVMSSRKHRGATYKSYAFTELGIAMLSSVLKSDRAVQMNIFIMRAFVKLREMLATNTELAKKIGELEKGQKEHTNNLIVITTALNSLRDGQKKLEESHKPLKSAIGFQA